MLTSNRFSRRHILGSIGGIGAISFLAACSQAAPAAPTAAPATSAPAKAPTKAAAPAATVAQATATTAAPKPTAAPKAAATGSSKTTQIVFYVWGGAPEKKVFDAEVSAFEKKTPTIKVKDEVLGSAFGQKLTAAFAAGTPPDSFYSGGVPFNSAKIQQLLPLDSYVQADKVNLNDYFPTTIKAYQYKGHLYSLPNECGPRAIYYDEELFTAAGQKTPSELVKAGTWSWTDLVNLAKATSKPPDQYGFDIWPWDLVQIYAWDQGEDLVDNDLNPTKSNWNQPIGEEVLAFYNDLANKYKVLPSPAFEQAHGGSGSVAVAMESNRLAMGVQGAWERLFLESAKVTFKWNIAMMPKGSKTATTIGYASGFVATQGGKEHDATWEWIKFMGSAEGNKIYAGLIAVPPLISVAKSSWFLKRPPVNDKIDTMVYLDGLNASRPSINFPKINQYNTIVNNELDLVRLQKATPKEAAAAIHQQLTSQVFTAGGGY